MGNSMAPGAVRPALAIWRGIRATVRSLREPFDKHCLAAHVQETAADDVHEKASRRRLSNVILNEYEQAIVQDIIDFEDIEEDFSSIGGLDGTINSLRMAITLPLRRPELGRRPSRGVLLYGKEGTGKTHIAKAVAKEAEAIFIILDIGATLSKYQGESQKRVAAVFSLANKLQPAIIFVDEVDGLLSERHNGDHDSMDNLKSCLLIQWQGFKTDGESLVTVLAATNHIDKLDKAALRRFDTHLEVPMPGNHQRESILKVILGAAHLPDNMQEKLKDRDVQLKLADLAERTEGYSGSDLRDMCEAAENFPIRDYLNWECETGQQKNHWYKDNPLLARQVTLRKLQQDDFNKAISERNCPNKEGDDTLSNSSSPSSVMLLPSPPLSRKTTQSALDKVGGKRESPPLVATMKKVRIPKLPALTFLLVYVYL
eukprot:SM000236S08008  [mRNA]  locus=s236:58211:61003:- [translate_table: standard]